MEQKQVTVNGKTYTVSEVRYKDIVSIGQTDNSSAAKKLIQLSVNLTDEQYDNLSMKEGIELMKAVNELNGLAELGNFQKA